MWDRHYGKNEFSNSHLRIFAGSETSSFDIYYCQENPGLFLQWTRFRYMEQRIYRLMPWLIKVVERLSGRAKGTRHGQVKLHAAKNPQKGISMHLCRIPQQRADLLQQWWVRFPAAGHSSCSSLVLLGHGAMGLLTEEKWSYRASIFSLQLRNGKIQEEKKKKERESI